MQALRVLWISPARRCRLLQYLCISSLFAAKKQPGLLPVLAQIGCPCRLSRSMPWVSSLIVRFRRTHNALPVRAFSLPVNKISAIIPLRLSVLLPHYSCSCYNIDVFNVFVLVCSNSLRPCVIINHAGVVYCSSVSCGSGMPFLMFQARIADSQASFFHSTSAGSSWLLNVLPVLPHISQRT